MRGSGEASVPLTIGDLVAELSACGLKEGQTVLVHGSLSSLGWVVGGAEMVVRALLEAVGDSGTIMAPTQTWKNLDPSRGVHGDAPAEWWPLIREHWPAYEPEITPSLNMGAVAEVIRTWPGARRSPHLVRSFAALGANAGTLVAEQDLEDVHGDASPVGKLYDLDGHVLLLGVGHESNTSLHLAETRAEYPGKRFVEESSAVLVDGVRRWVTYRNLDFRSEDFAALGEEYESEHGVRRHRVGMARAIFMEQRSLVDWAVRWMEQNRWGLQEEGS